MESICETGRCVKIGPPLRELAGMGLADSAANGSQSFLVLIEPGLDFRHDAGETDEHVAVPLFLNQHRSVCEGLSEGDATLGIGLTIDCRVLFHALSMNGYPTMSQVGKWETRANGWGFSAPPSVNRSIKRNCREVYVERWDSESHVRPARVGTITDSPSMAVLAAVGLTIGVIFIDWCRHGLGAWHAPFLLHFSTFLLKVGDPAVVFIAVVTLVLLCKLPGMTFYRLEARERRGVTLTLVVCLQLLSLWGWIAFFLESSPRIGGNGIHFAQSLILTAAFWKAWIDAARKPAPDDAFVMATLFEFWLLAFSTPWDTPIFI